MAGGHKYSVCQLGNDKSVKKNNSKGRLRMTERGAAMLLGRVKKGFIDKMIFTNRLEKSGGKI